MGSFFDPNVHSSTRFEMGSVGFLVLVGLLFVQLAALIAFRRQLPALRASRAFMMGTASFVLGIEVLSYVFKFVYPCDPPWERAPLHLCSTLKFLLTAFILLGRFDLVKLISVIAIGCGFISFANLNLNGGDFGNFAFWHYCIGHYYLFSMPLLLFLTGDVRYDWKSHGQSMLVLGLWSLAIFGVNWALDTNWMYSGPHNDVKVPFLPAAFMEWPFNYVSYVVIAMLMLNVTYAILKTAQRR